MFVLQHIHQLGIFCSQKFVEAGIIMAGKIEDELVHKGAPVRLKSALFYVVLPSTIKDKGRLKPIPATYLHF